MNSFLKKFVIGEWNLGISNQNFLQEFAKVKKDGKLKLRAQWVSHNRYGSFFADPFIFSLTNNTAEILAEEYIFSIRKGVISLCTINRKSAKMESRRVILEESCHLSYPFYDNDTQCFMPESSRNKSWASYNFDGTRITDKHIIAHKPFIDCTPIQWHGRWYLFTVEQPNALDTLLVFSSDKKDGEYIPHPLNPVKHSIVSSRPGGRCFLFNDELYRIVQDSTRRYGEKLHITHITELSETNFEEEYWCEIEIENNNRYPLGFHTLNFKDDFIVIDGFREVFRPFFATYIYKIVPILSKLGLHK